ncbi:MAG: monovalent cation/H+ antiporter subunit D family protein, partial [Actinobacteria bacterium]|nr:monovalent cation/H+ antiporter subunit D family protein [Actinomycetota bacterium]
MPWLALVGAMLWNRRRPGLAKVVYIGSTVATILAILPLYPRALDGAITTQRLVSIAPRISLAFRVDTVGFYFALLLGVLWLLCSIYSLGYIQKNETRYYCFLSLNLSFCLGVALSANMFTLFIFYELMTLFTYPLIIHEETEQARKAGLKYLVYSVSAGAVIMLGLILQYYYGGTLSFLGHGTLKLSQVGKPILLTIFSIYMLGFGVKACIMPLHGWVPDAHPAAPAPASALLSGVILKVGIFGIIRVMFDVFGIELLKTLGVALPMLIVASFSIIVGSLFALTQDELKRRLAYSSVAQVAYIVLGLFLLAPDGAIGGLLHIAHHAFMKGCLFLAAGVIIHETGKKKVSEMSGIGSRIPLTMAAFAVGALGMMGIPLTCGFITKWFLGLGTIQAHHPCFIAVLLISSLLNAVYFLPIVYVAFFKGESPEGESRLLRRETKRSMLVPVMICAGMIIILGVFVTVKGFPYSLVEVVV